MLKGFIMQDLLIGCKVRFERQLPDGTGETREGIVIRVETIGNKTHAFVAENSGKIAYCFFENITIVPEDIRFLNRLNQDHKVREELLEKIDRFSIMDL